MTRFNDIYEKELGRIKPNVSLKRELGKKLGFGFRFGQLFRASVFAPAALTLVIGLVIFDRFYQPGIVPLVQPVKHQLAAVFDSGRDDWQLDQAQFQESSASNTAAPMGLSTQPSVSFGLSSGGAMDLGLSASTSIGLSAPSTAMPSSKALGFAVGGAKDVETFRANIKSGYLPKFASVTPEGLYGEYFFDLGVPQDCAELFCPSYSRAISPDPISGQDATYLAVGLNSNLQADAFQRGPLDLVIVLDISGSMASDLNSYYYDGQKPMPLADETAMRAMTKLQAAKESINALFSHLNNDDRVGIVLFDDRAYLAKPLNLVGETDMSAIKAHIDGLAPGGGTDMSAGIRVANDLFDDLKPEAGRQRRMIFLTDAMPNQGVIGDDGLLAEIKQNADRQVFTTVVGIGLDFQSTLIEAISKARGANYYSVHTPDDFRKRMDKNFDYMVTPLVFDLELKLEATGYEIEKVYGSPQANESTGQLLKVATLFPSETNERGTRGGLVLLRLKRISDNASLRLVASYSDVQGARHQNTKEVSFQGVPADKYDNNGIRKGVLLSRYADLLGSWILDDLNRKDSNQPDPFIVENDGIMPLQEPDAAMRTLLSRWEQGSVPLTVSVESADRFRRFRAHFVDEQLAIGDAELKRELEVIDKILAAPPSPSYPVIRPSM